MPRECHVAHKRTADDTQRGTDRLNAAVAVGSTDLLGTQFNFLDVDRTFTVDHDEFALFFEVMEVGSLAPLHPSCIAHRATLAYLTT